MVERIAGAVSSWGPEAITLLLAALPISELRGSIPWATFMLAMNWKTAFALSIVGNMLPIPLILLTLKVAEKDLIRSELLGAFFRWLFAQTRRRGRIIERYQMLGLVMFVALPLPVTGAWTGALAAHLFGIRTNQALLGILCGVLIAGVIVTMACQGVLGVWSLRG